MYWDSGITPNGNGLGVGTGEIAGASGVSAAKLIQKSTFVGWDFANVWTLSENVGYPQLR